MKDKLDWNKMKIKLFLSLFIVIILTIGILFELKKMVADLQTTVVDRVEQFLFQDEMSDETDEIDQVQIKTIETELKTKSLSIEALTNRVDELVFSISLNDFIESFNAYYVQDYEKEYLSPTSNWKVQIQPQGIHSPYQTIRYHFIEDENNWTLPTIRVNTYRK